MSCWLHSCHSGTTQTINAFVHFFQVQQSCTGSPPIERIDPTNSEWKTEVAEFLWPATESALQETPPNRTTVHTWPLRPSPSTDELRREQQRSYLRMEQLIEEFMLPERLFGEHLGQPCLLGSQQRCWNGHKFEE